jgi:hypothetical protein
MFPFYSGIVRASLAQQHHNQRRPWDATATLAGERVCAYIPVACDIINFIATLSQQTNARNVPFKFRCQTYFAP